MDFGFCEVCNLKKGDNILRRITDYSYVEETIKSIEKIDGEYFIVLENTIDGVSIIAQSNHIFQYRIW